MERTDDAPHDGYTIELILPTFQKVVRANDWTTNAEIAEALCISERQVHRIRTGSGRPGTDFIGGLLMADDLLGFRRLFRIVPKSDPIRKD
ncbi:MAG TPA: hypothetical protein VGD91_25850 [Trebonia sp.]